MEFGQKIRRLMGQNRVSQQMLADSIGVSQNLVSLWARGKSVPDIETAFKISRFFNVSVEFLADPSREIPDPSSFQEERMVEAMVRDLGHAEARRRLMQAPAQVSVTAHETGHAIGAEDRTRSALRNTGPHDLERVPPRPIQGVAIPGETVDETAEFEEELRRRRRAKRGNSTRPNKKSG